MYEGIDSWKRPWGNVPLHSARSTRIGIYEETQASVNRTARGLCSVVQRWSVHCKPRLALVKAVRSTNDYLADATLSPNSWQVRTNTCEYSLISTSSKSASCRASGRPHLLRLLSARDCQSTVLGRTIPPAALSVVSNAFPDPTADRPYLSPQRTASVSCGVAHGLRYVPR